jgi:DNA-directed RNA polymerase subunit N (RpoN/RPB10)
MKKNTIKEKKKRILAMNLRQRVYMAKVLDGLAKNEEIKNLSGAAEKLGTNQANCRRALLGHSKGEKALEIKAELEEMAGIKQKPKKAVAS